MGNCLANVERLHAYAVVLSSMGFWDEAFAAPHGWIALEKGLPSLFVPSMYLYPRGFCSRVPGYRGSKSER
jgi:hypothetical protein